MILDLQIAQHLSNGITHSLAQEMITTWSFATAKIKRFLQTLRLFQRS